MAITVATSNSVKKAFAPLGSAFDNSYPEIVTVLGSTSADEERISTGNMFIAGDYSSAVSYNTGVNILIQNGANDGIKLIAEILTSVDCTVQLFETPTFSAAGSAITPKNLNRSSAKVLGATITKNPTLSADGTQIGPTILNQGNIQKALLENAIILAPSTNYLIKIVSISSYIGIINTLLQIYQPNL